MRLRTGLLALVATAVLAPAALAAPTHTATLDASKTSFTWDGAPASSLAQDPPFNCETGAHCEDVLFNIAAPGELHLKLESAAGQPLNDPSGEVCGDTPCASYQDFDGYFYKSNAAGEPDGDALGEADTDCSSSYASEECKFPGLEPGYYLLRVVYFLTYDEGYKGTATLAPTGGAAAPAPTAPGSTPPAGSPPPPPQGQPAPPQSQPQGQPAPASKPAAKKKKKASKRKACIKKARKMKNKRKRAKALKRCKKIKR